MTPYDPDEPRTRTSAPSKPAGREDDVSVPRRDPGVERPTPRQAGDDPGVGGDRMPKGADEPGAGL